MRYFLADGNSPVEADDPLWERPLPTGRRASPAADADSIGYGDYFCAVEDYLGADGGLALSGGLQGCGQPSLALDDIGAIDVYLVKHGQLYHPARITLTTPAGPLELVLNVAVSADGQKTLPIEFEALHHLNATYPFSFVPQVYHHGHGHTPAGRRLPMFLGQWFDGYHEFHPSAHSRSGQLHLQVWDGTPDRFLSHAQGIDLYRRAALILTAYFDPVEYRHIYPWHHAAGDFVVAVDGDTIDLKLITVRAYHPLAGTAEAGAPALALEDALVLLALSLSLKMRLDRLGGSGAVTWAPAACLEGTLAGFWQGLDLVARMHALPDGFVPEVWRYFESLGPNDWLQIGRMLIAGYPPQSEDATCLANHVDSHSSQLAALLGNIRPRNADDSDHN
jgi:hypothetical protein